MGGQLAHARVRGGRWMNDIDDLFESVDVRKLWNRHVEERARHERQITEAKKAVEMAARQGFEAGVRRELDRIRAWHLRAVKDAVGVGEFWDGYSECLNHLKEYVNSDEDVRERHRVMAEKYREEFGDDDARRET